MVNDYQAFKNSVVGIKVDEAKGVPVAHVIVDIAKGHKGKGIISATVTPILLSYSIALGKQIVSDAIEYATAIVDGEIDSDKGLYETAKDFLKQKYNSTGKLISKLLLKPLFLENVLSSTYSSVLEKIPQNTSVGQWMRNQVLAKEMIDAREAQAQVQQAEKLAKEAGWYCDACQRAYSANTKKTSHNQTIIHQQNVRRKQKGEQPVTPINFKSVSSQRSRPRSTSN